MALDQRSGGTSGPVPSSSRTWSSIVELLRHRAEERGPCPLYTFLADGEHETSHRRWADVDDRARAISVALAERVPGSQRALLALPPSLDFIDGFLGCLYASVVAVPVALPRSERSLPAFAAIVRDAEPQAVLTLSSLAAEVRARLERCGARNLHLLTIDDLPAGLEAAWRDPGAGPGTLAFLQYTSGSTGSPRGVMVSHGNLLHNQALIQRAFQQDEDSLVVGWLPLHHDMGLVGTVLQPLYSGGRCVLMPPAAFLQKPVRWLRCISRYAATTSGGPNFAYDLCVRKVPPAEREDLDLSSWRCAFNGAETVRADTLARFSEAFAHAGFRAQAFRPCYGLAEATLLVAAGGARPSAKGGGAPSSGRVVDGLQAVIVDPAAATPRPPGSEGEVWLRGPSIARGYWNRSEETSRTFAARMRPGDDGPFLRTGDLGVIRDGELFITGRLKDLVIVRGRNHHPEDIEWTVRLSHPALRYGAGAAFSVEVAGEERLVLVHEVEGGRQAPVEDVVRSARRDVAQGHELQVHDFVLVRMGSLPRTTSGKVQRFECRRRYLEDQLLVVARRASVGGAEAEVRARDAETALAPGSGAGGPALERMLVEIAASVVGVPASDIDPEQPLLALGLDSLKAVELERAIAERLNVSLGPSLLLDGCSISSAARLLLAEREGRPLLEEPERIGTAHHEASVHPLSIGQKALWFLHRLDPEGGAYELAAALRVRGRLDVSAARRALRVLAERHPMLRARFVSLGEEVGQRFDAPIEGSSELDGSEWTEEQVQRWLQEEAARRFDLERGPLWRVAILTRSPEERVVLLAAHHSVIDLRSLEILARELGELYVRLAAGAPGAAVAEPRLRYADYVHWQERWLAGPRGERDWAYWKGQLRGPLPVLGLAADRPRRPATRRPALSRHLRTSSALLERLQSLARAHDATLYVVLLTAFQVLLCRHTGQEDLLVATPFLGRASPELADLVGYFVNLLPLRADLSGDPTFAEALARSRRTVLEALEHGSLPFPVLVERLPAAREVPDSPRFQAMFVLEEASRPELQPLALLSLGEAGPLGRFGALTFESLAVEKRAVQCDLTLKVAPAGSTLAAALTYDADLFDGSRVERLLRQFVALLEGVCAEPWRRIRELPLLSVVEEHALRVEWSGGAGAVGAGEGCLHELFEAVAAGAPEKEAVVFEGEAVSYGELNRRANALAWRLVDLGVGAESRVGILLDRSVEMVVSLLGVLKAGGGYVGLDPGYPAERLRWMVEDAGVEVVLTREWLREGVGGEWGGVRWVLVEEAGEERGENLGRRAWGRNLAYVIYTSGSTGRAKGVAIEHRSAVELMRWVREEYGAEDLGGMLASTSIGFDLSVFELFGALSWGGRVILVESVLELLSRVGGAEVRLVNTVPSAMWELLRGGWEAGGVRTVNLAGESVPAGLVEGLYGAGVGRVYNLYGPSEDTTYSTFGEVGKEEGGRASIGRPTRGRRVYVLDEGMGLVPVGAVGELYVGGEGLARGYLNRPELTAERFVPDPLGEEAGGRLYRTGDLVRHRGDGRLEFLGRRDTQVKLRGFRIEPAEIEGALRAQAGVEEAVVLLREDADGQKRLVAYLVLDPQQPADDGDLRRALRRELPSHMVPADFVAVDSIVKPRDRERLEGVAVIGLAGRFPGAGSVDELWRNLFDGTVSISSFDDEELERSGVGAAVYGRPGYVRAKGALAEVEGFDAAFFGFSAREAEIMDPQHRLFLECCWEALENAGHDFTAEHRRVGVYAGCGLSTYLLTNLLSNPAVFETVNGLQVRIANDKDFLTTQVSYQLDLKGPSMAVQTACSTSLVAVHVACQALLDGECDAALAGGVAVSFPHRAGYLFQEGGIWSPDGHCRAFDRRAGGTVEGNGAGVVVLKRLADAMASGDFVHAVVKGSAVNNDGALKVGYTAPSVESQAEVVAEALSMAGVDPDSLGYLEAHGSGTPLGDPVEVEALTRVFRASTARRGFCALGSVKANLGHLDNAAGIASFIKAVGVVECGRLPPAPDFEEPNPRINLAESPFYVNTVPREWPPQAGPRRAGVSSLGIGGTNAHIVLEQAPPAEPGREARPWPLILLSARTPTALDAARRNLARRLREPPGLPLADVAYTLQVGRKHFAHRAMLVAEQAPEAAECLDAARGLATGVTAAARGAAFLFPGLGDHHVGMGQELYRTEPLFRRELDACAEILKPHLNRDLREVLYPRDAPPRPAGSGRLDFRRLVRPDPEADEPSRQLNQTYLAQPAVFAVEYALARLLLAWGIRPAALIGYSLGEYVAACLAGVFELKEALALVAERARLIHELPAGAMLAVPLAEGELAPYLRAGLAVSAADGGALSIVGGAPEAVAELEARLAAAGVATRALATSHAFHTAAMEPILERFGRRVAATTLHPPSLPFVSNVTGRWVLPEEATDPGYWVRHLRQTVRFGDGLGEVLADPSMLLVEVGPGQALAALARQHPRRSREHVVVSVMPDRREGASEARTLMTAVGRLWLAGAEVDWRAFHGQERRRRVPLPTYPFERRRYWIEPGRRDPDVSEGAPAASRRKALPDWFHLPIWRQAPLPTPVAARDLPRRWLVFLDAAGLGERLCTVLTAAGHDLTTVRAAAAWSRLGPQAYAIDPTRRADYDALVAELRSQGRLPDRIAHLWSVTTDAAAADDARVLALGFYSLLLLGQALGEHAAEWPVVVGFVSNGLQDVTGDEAIDACKAAALGPVHVLPQESPSVSCRSIDLVLPAPATGIEDRLARQVVAEMEAEAADAEVAYRGARRWVRAFAPARLAAGSGGPRRLRPDATYLINGLEETALVLAEQLVERVGANVGLVAPPGFPARSKWERWLAAHDPQDATSRQVRRLRALEAAGGGRFLFLVADPASEEQLRAALAQTRTRFQGLHGVLHVTPAPGAGLIQLKTRADASAALEPTVKGTQVLEAATQGLALEFVALFSSLAALAGGFGQVDVSAGHAFLDATARRSHLAGRPEIVSIDWGAFRWDEWQLPAAASTGVQTQVRQALDEHGIDAAEAVAALDLALCCGLPQVVVCSRDLQTVLRATAAMNPAAVLAALGRAGSLQGHARPDLAVLYVAPRSDAERAIAALWQETFGLEQVGVDDNFFDLGGNSLTAIQIVTRLRKLFGVELPMSSVLEAPTVAGLARKLEGPGLADPELGRLLDEVEGLSPEEAAAQVAEAAARPPAEWRPGEL